MGGDEICNNKYIVNVFGTSLNLFKYYHAQCFFSLSFLYYYLSIIFLAEDWMAED